MGGPDNLLSGWRSEAEPQEVTDGARISRRPPVRPRFALPHPGNK